MALKRWHTLVAVVVSLSCGDDGSTAPDEFLPAFTYAWQNTVDPNHVLNLVSADDFQRSGVIVGTESLNSVESDVDGTFEGVRVTNLTIHRATADKVYTGRLVEPTVLLLVSGPDSIVLNRPQ
jgi:hypothetical protein